PCWVARRRRCWKMSAGLVSRPTESVSLVRRYVGEGEDAVMVVNADGSGEQKLATRKHPDYFLPGAAWSPDGQTIACPAGGFTGGYNRSVVAVQMSDGSPRPL